MIVYGSESICRQGIQERKGLRTSDSAVDVVVPRRVLLPADGAQPNSFVVAFWSSRRARMAVAPEI